MCLGAVGSAETADMLCGLSRDSPAEAGTWNVQAPHQLQRGACMLGMGLPLWKSGGKEDMGSLTRQVLRAVFLLWSCPVTGKLPPRTDPGPRLQGVQSETQGGCASCLREGSRAVGCWEHGAAHWE